MWTVTFWKDTAERAIATAAQTLAALLGVDALNLLAVSWPALLSAAGAAALLSVLKALAAATLVGEKGTASLVDGAREPYIDDGPRHAA